MRGKTPQCQTRLGAPPACPCSRRTSCRLRYLSNLPLLIQEMRIVVPTPWGLQKVKSNHFNKEPGIWN